MKLGILSDIHEAVELLERALAQFDREGVEQVIILGDLFETGPRMDETCDLLARAGAIGVWGNHDYGLCIAPSPFVRERYSAEVLSFMATLHPRIEVEGCLFAHREPRLDPTDLAEIWHVDDPPLSPGLVELSFAAVPNRSIFVGHFHRWVALGREGPLPWDGRSPLVLPADAPTLVVINGVCEGYAATFETATGELVPRDLYRGHARPDRRPLPRLVEG